MNYYDNILNDISWSVVMRHRMSPSACDGFGEDDMVCSYFLSMIYFHEPY